MSLAAALRRGSGGRTHRRAALAWLLALLPGCRNDISPAAPGSAAMPVEMVSDAMRHAVAEQASAPTVVYVSRAAEEQQLGTVVEIETPRGTSVTTHVGAHGFGPVAVAAEAGDTITLRFHRPGDTIAATAMREIVPRGSRPRVVRTVPPRGKTDIPLNARLMVVFSEPVNPASLEGRVRLNHLATSVPGVLRMVDSSHTVVEFVPDDALDPLTTHELVVDAGVRDLSGDALEAGVRVSFATGQGLAGPPAAIELIPDSLVTIPVGSAMQVQANVIDASGNVLDADRIEWSVSDPEHLGGLAVSPSGLITTTSDGNYVVTATSGSLRRSLWVYVRPDAPALVAIVPAIATVPLGDTLLLTATIRDAAGRRINRPAVSWTSGQPSRAAILINDNPATARVIGAATGTATVSATSGNATGTAEITVGPSVPVASLTVAPDTIRMIVDGSAQVTVTLRDATGRVIGRDVTWKSSDESIATVDATGRVTGVRLGATTVSATSEGITESATVRVIPLVIVSIVPGTGWYPSNAHTCALADTGDAYCWGRNQSGQTGIGAAGDDVSRPTAVRSAGRRFSAIAAGRMHSCALTPDGRVFCWGNADYGQVANTADCHDYEGNAWCSLAPVELPTEKPLASISAGGWHSCGLTANGDAYCWGYNHEGQLGNGTTAWNWAGTLHRVEGGLTFSAVSAGETHSCGLTVQGKPYCWGDLSGAGNAALAAVTRPVAVETDLTFVSLSAGYRTTCALTAAGAAYCWPTGGRPSPLRGDFAFSSISTGDFYGCGVTTEGRALCWGSNDYGNLGDGSYAERDTPTPVAGGLTFSQVRAGGGHTCGITTDGIAYCWGANGSRQLGSESTDNSAVPVRVARQP